MKAVDQSSHFSLPNKQAPQDSYTKTNYQFCDRILHSFLRNLNRNTELKLIIIVIIFYQFEIEDLARRSVVHIYTFCYS